ncbi:MAG: dTDP-4-dehydrorhamnose reductase [Burkholderiales bacterium]|jgi:dTDP-4-dehydrorhamnose reductase|nr:dTDP-4-dehydrorhamnose reductase [Burkholderiales bacterium]
MRVVLLGPNGQLGSDIRRAHAMAQEGIDLVPLGRERLDVTASRAIETTLGAEEFDALINCTSYHRTDEAEDNADLAIAVNAHAVQGIAKFCASKGARFLHVSTDYVFGGDATRTLPLCETDPIAPLNVYGASKALGETLARLACADTLILRVASLFGVDGASGKGGNFVETMIRAGYERGALRVVDDQIMSPTATTDVASAILALLRQCAAPGIYHVVNSGQASWFDFASEIIRLAGVPATVTRCTSADYPTRAMRPRYSSLDTGKLSDILGQPLPPWQEALQRYLRAKGHVG